MQSKIYFLIIFGILRYVNSLDCAKEGVTPIGFFPKNYFAYPTLSANPTTSLPLFVKEL
jgi:hypothetical protein